MNAIWNLMEYKLKSNLFLILLCLLLFFPNIQSQEQKVEFVPQNGHSSLVNSLAISPVPNIFKRFYLFK